MGTIDWGRTCGEIVGAHSVPGARYVQDGKYYRPDGSEVVQYQGVAVDALELKKDGLSDTEIGERLGISRQKVTKLLCKLTD